MNVNANNTKVLLENKMTPFVKPGEIRFVLSWESPMDLDIHSIFRISNFQKCEVYFGRSQCLGTELNSDIFRGEGTRYNTMTISTLGNYIYTIAVHNYVANNSNTN